jgi:hypothetical protein
MIHALIVLALLTSPAASSSRYEGEGISWQLPSDWKQVRAAGMRYMTITAPDNIEIAVFAFPDDVGGLLANVNRWRSQIGLEPITEERLPQCTSSLKFDNGDGTLVDLSNPERKNARLIAAVLQGKETTWVIRMTGTFDPLDKLKPAFVDFIRTIRVDGGSQK